MSLLAAQPGSPQSSGLLWLPTGRALGTTAQHVEHLPIHVVRVARSPHAGQQRPALGQHRAACRDRARGCEAERAGRAPPVRPPLPAASLEAPSCHLGGGGVPGHRPLSSQVTVQQGPDKMVPPRHDSAPKTGLEHVICGQLPRDTPRTLISGLTSYFVVPLITLKLTSVVF